MLIGLPSSGVHSNGYSLVRRLVAEARLAWDAPAPFAPATSLAEALLVPTRIYVKPVLAAIRATRRASRGWRTSPAAGSRRTCRASCRRGWRAHIDLGAWKAPPVFGWLRQAGNLDDAEMLRTFNCGIGMVARRARRRTPTKCWPRSKPPARPRSAIGEIEPGRGVKSRAKGKGEAEAVRYLGRTGSLPDD